MIDTIPERNFSAAVHERVAEAVEAAIAEGHYGPGDKLPTHRALAQQLAVSIGSVTRAIESLSLRGIVSSEVGRGTFVRDRQDTLDVAGPVDLSINAPPPLVDAAQLTAATALATQRALQFPMGGYGEFLGTPAQRDTIASWLSSQRTALSGDDVILCNGAQQAIHLAFGVLRDVAPIVVTESASFAGAINAAANLGLGLRPVAHDSEGPLPDALAEVLREAGPAIVYLTPVCQNPLGYESGSERRAALAEVVAAHGGYIVEDDIYGVYSGKPGPLYRDLLPDRTFYITSLSKSLTPLVRLGVIAPPAGWALATRRRLRAESWGLPPFVAELAACLVETGAADAALPALRSEARARLDLTRSILGIEKPPMPAGAPHVWLPLGALRAEQLARRASEAGVRLSPPTAMQVGPQPVPGIRLCIVAPGKRSTLERGLRIVAQLLAEDDEVVV